MTHAEYLAKAFALIRAVWGVDAAAFFLELAAAAYRPPWRSMDRSEI